MRFCKLCGSLMKKITTDNKIIFECRCLETITGDAEDTLMFESLIESSNSNLKHDVFIDNSAFDPAANIVMKDCPRCSLNFMAMIRVGNSDTTIFTCRCGYRATYAQYTRDINLPNKKN
jgi:DNA-directed RNA polymerase subunit M/transcription elongation factor TFIIS